MWQGGGDCVFPEAETNKVGFAIRAQAPPHHPEVGQISRCAGPRFRAHPYSTPTLKKDHLNICKVLCRFKPAGQSRAFKEVGCAAKRRAGGRPSCLELWFGCRQGGVGLAPGPLALAAGLSFCFRHWTACLASFEWAFVSRHEEE